MVCLINEVYSPRAMEEERKYPNDEILLNWHQEFYRPDISNERIYRREPKKLKENIIQSVLEDGIDRSETVRPWNYEDYLYRLRTYKSSTWFAKPSIISPLCCARYGWINISSDTLKCVSCNKEITHERGLAPTPNMLTSLGDYSGEEFAEKLITAHDPRACGWINDDQTPISYNFSPESFLYFPNQTLDARLLTFQSRFVAWYHQLIASSAQIQVPREISEWRSFYLFIHDSLSPSSTSLTLESKEEPQHKFDLRLKQYLLSLLKNSGVTISDSVLLDAFILSLYCWDLTKSQPNSPPCSSCSMCGRNFSMCTTSERNQVVNPSQEHKYYCPVVSSYVPPPSSSCSEPVPSGYLQMIEALLMSIMDWKDTEAILQKNPDSLPISAFTVDSTKLKRSFGQNFSKLSSTPPGKHSSPEIEPSDSESIDVKYKKIKSVLSMVPSSRK